MKNPIGAFFSLYLATMILLLSSGLFNTYLGLRLTADAVSEIWVGGLIAAYYLGLVLGARIGHKLIIRVGHIRAYAASAALVTITILAMVLQHGLWFWLSMRFIAGMAMVCLFIAIESWLNEQTENANRGTVFSFYMVATWLGTVLGQLALSLFGELDNRPLIFVAICSVLSLIPVTLTKRLHPALQVPVPLAVKYYVNRVPMSMTVLFIAGVLTGAFYGLAPVYGLLQSMDNDQVALFLAISVAAGMVFQWPIGWLADRTNRVRIIQVCGLLLFLIGAPLWGWVKFPFWALLVFSGLLGVVQFTLYPVGAAFANDNVDPDRRVGLSALLYMVYGLGACVGPLLAGTMMRTWGADMYFVFVSICATLLLIFVREKSVKGVHLSEDAPTQFVPMADTLQNAHVMAVLDPRVDIELDVSHDPVTADELQPAATQTGPEAKTTPDYSASSAPSGPESKSGPAPQ